MAEAKLTMAVLAVSIVSLGVASYCLSLTGAFSRK
jgi:hypothetical protein